MKVLLDENLPHDLRHFLPGHEVITAAFLGCGGLENGALLARAASNGFDVVITKDAGIRYEQNLVDLPLSVVILRSSSNALEVLRPLVPKLLKALDSLQARTLVVVTE